MKELKKIYAGLDNEEKNNLWKNCTFVFDNNVLLNLYRNSNDTRELLFKALETYKDRIWLPHQIIVEFFELRPQIIYESVNKYDKAIKDFKETNNKIIRDLRATTIDPALKSAETRYINALNKQKEIDLKVIDPNNDEILSKLTDLFDGKIGEIYTNEELNKIYNEGKTRYSMKIPPGYKDASKEKELVNSSYGDLIIWKSMIKHSKDNHVDIIFVTNDQKEDWWYETHGRTIGPRYQLTCEFNKETEGKFFHMYTMHSFLERFSADQNLEIEGDILDEIKSLEQSDNIDNHNDLWNNNNFIQSYATPTLNEISHSYYKVTSSELEKALLKIDSIKIDSINDSDQITTLIDFIEKLLTLNRYQHPKTVDGLNNRQILRNVLRTLYKNYDKLLK